MEQGGKRVAQMPLGVVVERAFTRELPLFSKESKGHHFTARDRRQRSGFRRFLLQLRLPNIIHHDIQYGLEGIQIYAELAPFPGGLEIQAPCMGWIPCLSTPFYFTIVLAIP